MEKRFTERRGIAWIVFAAVVAASVFGIGIAKLSGVAASCEDTAGVLRDDLAMQMNAASAIVSAAEQAVPDAMSLADVKEGLAAYEAADTLAEQYAAASALSSDVSLLYEEARTVLGDDKGGVLQTQYSEYLSRGNIIRQSSLPEYNEDARAVQKKLSGFPASLLAKLAGLSADVIS